MRMRWVAPRKASRAKRRPCRLGALAALAGAVVLGARRPRAPAVAHLLVPRVWPRAARLAGGVGGSPALRGDLDLAEALRSDGVVEVELAPTELEALDRALGAFAGRGAFRYPPVPAAADAASEEGQDREGAESEMPAAFGCCFDTLYGVAVAAASTLLGVQQKPLLRSPCSGGTRPFEGEGGPWPYSASFFNIFNYDHGCLNAHRDRGVLTVVYGASSEALGQDAVARLWLKVPGLGGPDWLAAPPGRLLLWAGEGLACPGVEPIEHCVRVDPAGSYIEHSHMRRDPAAPLSGNRRSVALVLDE